MSNEFIQMTELEVQLSADENGQIRTEICIDFSQQASEWKRQLDRGLPPEEFEKTQRVVDGLYAAVSVVENFCDDAHR